jgi:hypothetical protein
MPASASSLRAITDRGHASLHVEEKSSTTTATHRVPQLVLPRSASVTRVFLYKVPEATRLLGYKTPDERKQLDLGAVSHVVDVTSVDRPPDVHHHRI